MSILCILDFYGGTYTFEKVDNPVNYRSIVDNIGPGALYYKTLRIRNVRTLL